MTGFHFTGTAVPVLPDSRFPQAGIFNTLPRWHTVQVMQMEIPFVLPRCDGYRNQVIIEKLRTIHTHFNEFEFHEYSYAAVS